MISWLTLVPVLAAVLGGAAAIEPPSHATRAYAERPQAPAPDTAIVRLRISRMTCGSCPTTARLALKKLAGVYGAAVTLDDSLGIVRYDPARVTPTQIAAHLTRATGFGATILPDTTNRRRRSEGA